LKVDLTVDSKDIYLAALLAVYLAALMAVCLVAQMDESDGMKVALKAAS